MVLDQSRKIWREKYFHGLDQIKTPINKLIRFLENYRDRYLVDSESFPGGCIFINLSVELDDQDTNLAQEVDRGFIGLKKKGPRILRLDFKGGILYVGSFAFGTTTRRCNPPPFTETISAP